MGRFREQRNDLQSLMALRQDWLDHPSVVPPRRSVAIRIQHRLSPAQVDELVAAYQAGATVQQLVGQFGLSRTTVLGHLQRRGIPRRHPTGMSELQVAQAKVLYEAGVSLLAVGQQLGFAHHTVRRYLARAGVQIRPRRGW